MTTSLSKRRNRALRRRSLMAFCVPFQLLGLTAACGPQGSDNPDTGQQPTAVVSQGSLPVDDPTLVFDAATSVWTSFSGSLARSTAFGNPCDASDPAFSKDTVYVPFRRGPTPWQLSSCWAGDAMPAGIPGGWARSLTPVKSPAVARLGSSWVMLYSAQTSTGAQYCIGGAVSNSPTGPGWFHGTAPLVCPPGQNATHPELFHDAQTSKWFLLWTESRGACDARLMIQELDAATVRLTGTAREMLVASNPLLGFSEISAAGCPAGGGQHRAIESPTMVRADSGELWLFFSANASGSANYATGWARCGTGSPAAGGSCTVPNRASVDEFRPLWGVNTRTASWPGANAKPLQGYPNLPGFGEMSLAVTSPLATGGQAVFATSRLLFGTAPIEAVFRLDRSGSTPMLHEPDPVTWHGKPNTFGDQTQSPAYPRASTAPNTPSGQPVAARPVEGFAWSQPGVHGLFNAIATDGTYLTGGMSQSSNNLKPSSDFTLLGAFDPRLNRWQNVKVLTSKGKESIPGRHSWIFNEVINAGGFISDVQALDDNAVAFVISSSFPAAYYGRDPARGAITPVMPAEGVWPAFGIVTRDGDEWKVSQQWTGEELRTLAGSDPALANQICPNTPHVLPPGVSVCHVLNEMALLPHSKDLVITQHLVSSAEQGGLAILDVTKVPNTNPPRFTLRWKAAYKYPLAITNLAGRVINPLIEEVQADPSSAVDDERFFISFDASFEGTLEYSPNVIHEFRYKASEPDPYKAIVPSSPPFRAGDSSIATARYDRHGNLWTKGEKGMSVYAKHADGRKYSRTAAVANNCGFRPADREFKYWTGNDWGQTCAPDYVIRQPEALFWEHGTPPGKHPGSYLFTHSPKDNLIVGTNMGYANPDVGQVLPIRYAGSGANMTFQIGNITDTGLGFFDPNTWKQIRQGAFDKNGRMWSMVQHVPGDANHWLAVVDTAQLFDPPPVVLSPESGVPTKIQAENIAGTAMQSCAGAACATDAHGSRVIDPRVLVQTSSRLAADVTVGTGDGTVMVTDGAGIGHKAGVAEYRVYAPKARRYRIDFYMKAAGATGGKITATVDSSTTGPFATATSTNWLLARASDVLTLSPGSHTIKLTPPANTSAAQVHIDYFTMTVEE